MSVCGRMHTSAHMHISAQGSEGIYAIYTPHFCYWLRCRGPFPKWNLRRQIPESWAACGHCWSRVHQDISVMAGGSGASSGNVAICHIKSFTNNRVPLD